MNIIFIGVGLLAFATTPDATKIYSSSGTAFPRAFITYTHTRPTFPQCCNSNDAKGCLMVRISDAVHDAVDLSGQEETFTTSANEKLVLEYGVEGLYGQYTNSNGLTYDVIAPSEQEKKLQPCKSSRVPSSQSDLYYKIVPSIGRHVDDDHQDDDEEEHSSEEVKNDESDNSNTGADEVPATQAPVIPTTVSDWGDCELNDDELKRYKTCSGPDCDNFVLEQLCEDAAWSAWSTCLGEENSTRTRNDCSFAEANQHFCVTAGDQEVRDCVIPGVLGEWTAWSACSLETLDRNKYKVCHNPENITLAEIGDREVECEIALETEGCKAHHLTCSQKGELISPGYPAPYGDNINNFIQTIEVGENSNLHINITDMDLEYGPNCQYDSLVIREKASKKIILDKTCGTDLRNFVTTTNEVEVIFNTDSSQNGNGWKLTWCAPQVLQSSNWGGAYNNNEFSSKKVEVSADHRIRFEFLFLDIEEGGEDCLYDWVQICNDSSGKDCATEKLCGANLPSDYIYSNNNVAYVIFRSDSFGNRRGYQIGWIEANIEEDGDGIPLIYHGGY